jgi:hypothetical protein
MLLLHPAKEKTIEFIEILKILSSLRKVNFATFCICDRLIINIILKKSLKWSFRSGLVY